MRDITIGQYYAGDSVIHNLDPRTKLMGVLIFIVALFVAANPWWYLLCLGVVLALYWAAKVPLSYLMKGLRGIVVLLVFTFFFFRDIFCNNFKSSKNSIFSRTSKC